MPVLRDIYRGLPALDMPDAKYVTAALSIYVDGMLDLFNQLANVDIGNRGVCYAIRKLGKQLKELYLKPAQNFEQVSKNPKNHIENRTYVWYYTNIERAFFALIMLLVGSASPEAQRNLPA